MLERIEAELDAATDRLSPEHRGAYVAMVMKIGSGAPIVEADLLALPEPVRECVALLSGFYMLRSLEAQKVEARRAKDAPIKELAVKILGELRAAQPERPITELAAEAMAAAQVLHDQG